MLSDFILIDGERYEIVVIPQVRHFGQSVDGMVCHDTRRVFISAGVPVGRLPSLQDQILAEEAVLLAPGAAV